MDELTRNLALMENVAASDALNNAQAILEEAIEALKWKLGEYRLWADLALEPPPWVK